MKRTKSLFVALLVMVMCAVSLGFAQPVYAANENVLTVNVTDDYYGNPVDGVTVSVTDAATGAVVAEQVTNASGSATFSLPDGAYKVEQTKFKAGYVVDHSTKAVTFSGVARGTDDHQTVALEDVHIMGTLIPYADTYIRTTPGFLTDVYFNVEDEFGNRIATGVQGGTPLTVPVTGSYTLIPTQYPSRLSYDSSAVMFAEIFRCTQGGYGLVPLHAVTFAYNQTSRRFADEVKAAVILPTRKGNIIVKVVDTDGNPIAGATLKATAANVAGPRIPTPPFTQTGILTMEADGSYSLTTGADGSVVIPNLMGNTSTTITQLTTIDGYQIDTTVRVGQITGTNTTATVTFVDPRIPAPTPAPDPTPAPEPEPTPAPEPQPQPETPKAKKVKKSVLPDTGDNALTLPLIIGVAGATVVVAGAALFLHKKRQ